MIRVHHSVDELNHSVADLFVRTARDAIKARGRFSVALSGGSSPRGAYELLATSQSSEHVPWENVHVFWGDERCVPIDDPHSNAGNALKVFLDKVPIPPYQVHPMYNGQTPAEAAAEYEVILQRYFENNPPRFDLIFLGLGENGHTASLFPNQPALNEKKRWVMAVNIPDQEMKERLTLTVPIINLGRNVAFILFGEKKAETLKNVIEGPRSPDLLPAQLIAPEDGQLQFLVDQPAASLLTKAG
jgi:6-phosphogluconolactonase